MSENGCSGESPERQGELEVGHIQAPGDRLAVAPVTVEQLHNGGRLAELGDGGERVGLVDGVDDPHAPLVHERV